MRTLSQLLILLTALVLVDSCHYYKSAKLMRGGEVKQLDYFQEMPIDCSNNMVFAEVVINGKTYNFVFDTGAAMNVIGEHIADEVDYKEVTAAKVNAVQNKSKDRMEFVEVSKMTIANVDFENTGAIIADLSHMERILGCKTMDGLIGNNLMRKAGWQIDYENEILRVSDSADKFEMSDKAFKITMDAGRQGNVRLDVMVDSVPSRFTFDTGSGSALRADTNLLNSIKEKHPELQYMTEMGVTGADLHGLIIGKRYNALSRTIDVQGLMVTDQIISISDKSSYLMGNQIFSNYTLTIDWEKDFLYFDPIKEIEADSLDVLQLGFSPNYHSLQIEVNRFREEHPLDTPVSIGAQVINIDGEDVSTFATMEELCDYWRVKQEDLKKSKACDLVVLDEGVEKKVTLTKKLLLPK